MSTTKKRVFFLFELNLWVSLNQQLLVVPEDETFGAGESIVGKTLGGGSGGSLVQATTKLRPHYDRGQHFQPFYSSTRIPQHIPLEISLNKFRGF